MAEVYNPDAISYQKPQASDLQATATLSKNAPTASVFPSAVMGLIARTSGKKAACIGWEDVVYHLRWALERSPKMRADIYEMISAINGGERKT